MEEDNTMLVVALYGGPGAGKSTTMAGIFADLKLRGINCEMAPEFAKEKVWERSFAVLENQIYVFGKQLHALRRLAGQVQVAVTDSPLLLSLIYGKHEVPEFKDLVLAVNRKYWTLHVFLQRVKDYKPIGRIQTEAEAIAIDDDIRALLDVNKINYITVDATASASDVIVKHVLHLLGTIVIP